MKKSPFKPKRGEDYWLLIFTGAEWKLDKQTNTGNAFDKKAIKLGNCFRIKKDGKPELRSAKAFTNGLR